MSTKSTIHFFCDQYFRKRSNQADNRRAGTIFVLVLCKFIVFSQNIVVHETSNVHKKDNYIEHLEAALQHMLGRVIALGW